MQLSANEHTSADQDLYSSLRHRPSNSNSPTVSNINSNPFQQSSQYPTQAKKHPTISNTADDTMKHSKSATTSGLKSPFSYRVVICVVILLALIYLLSGTQNERFKSYYGVMIDAGSTGSRLHVFHFVSNDPSSGHMILKSEVFLAIKPGLSSYVDDPEAAAQSLVPLLELAMSTVPEKSRKITPLNLKATAGLRLLGEQRSQAILDEVEKLFKSYPFLYDPEDAVEVMSGIDEGLFAWITVNYLLESVALDAQETCVVLDLGGGSTQIALSSPRPEPGLRKSLTMGAEHHMFLYSHLGYGLIAGRGQMFGFEFNNGAPQVTGAEVIRSPCIPRGETFIYEYNQRKYRVTGASNVSAQDCLARAHSVIIDPNGSFAKAPPQPQIAPHQPIFAMSYYFDRAQDVGIIGPDAEQGSLSIKQYQSIAEQVCGLPTSMVISNFPSIDPEDAPYLCTDLCFISSLLEHGFGIQNDATIILARKLFFNGAAIETQWPLGAGLEEIFEELSRL